MRLILTLFTVHFSLFTADAQPAIAWAKCFGGSGTDYANAILQTDDKGYLILGTTASADGDVNGLHDSLGNDPDYWLIKLDENGNMEWQKCLGGTRREFASAMIKTSDGGYALCGYSWSPDGDVSGNGFHYSADFWVLKLGSDYELTWQRTYGGYNDDKAFTIAETKDGGYVVAGNANSPDGDVTGLIGKTDYWLIKLDSIGNLKWNRCYGGTGDETANSVIQCDDGGYILCGYTNSLDSEVTNLHKDINGNKTYDIWVVKTDSIGTMEWQKTYGGSGMDYGKTIIQTKDGGYTIFATTDFGRNDSGYYFYDDYWLIKVDATGTIVWQQSYGGSYYDDAATMAQTKDGGYLLSGSVLSNDMQVSGNHGGYDIWIVKTDSSGGIEWSKTVGGSRDDIAYSVIETKDGGVAVAGSTISYDGDAAGLHDNCYYDALLQDSVCNPDVWVLKLHPNVMKGPFNGNNNASMVNYPNPFDKNTTIVFNLDSLPDHCALIIYNSAGQMVRSRAITGHSNTIIVSREGLPKGIYLCNLIHNNKEVLAVGKLDIE